MEIDSRIYMLYDEVEEIRPGVAMACATRGKYLELDIYHNNTIIYSYNKISKYEIENNHLIVYKEERYYFSVHDIININSLSRLSDSINKKRFTRIGGAYRKIGKMYTCKVYVNSEAKQLIFNNELEILNSDFKDIHNFMSFGTISSFVTNISEERKLLGFEANKVVMWSSTGKVIYNRKYIVSVHNDEIVAPIEITVKLLILSILIEVVIALVRMLQM